MKEEHKDHLIKHGTIMLAATVLAGIFNYVFNVVMVRMLGPSDYGVLFSLTALFMIVSMPANTIQTTISKYISGFLARKQYGKMSFLLTKTLKRLSELLGILFIVYLLSSRIIANYLNIQLITPVIITGVILFFGLLFPVNYGAIQGLERFTEFGFVQILGAITRVGFGVLFVYIGWGVNGALFGSLVSCIFVLGSAWWYLRDIWGVRPFDIDIGKKSIYKYAIPVSIAYISYGIATYIDAVIVKHYFSPLLAGYYSGVSMIGKAFLFPPMAFAGAMFPKVSGHHESGRKTKHLLLKALIYGFLVCVIGIIVCVVFAKPLIYVLLKKSDITQETLSVMVPLLRLIGFAITPYGLACIVINYYLAKHWTRFLPYLVAATILQIILLILFHNTLIQVLTVLFVAGIFILLCGVPAMLYSKKKAVAI